jgi:hypothetical protein
MPQYTHDRVASHQVRLHFTVSNIKILTYYRRHFNEAHRAPRHCKQCVLTFKNSKMLDEHYRAQLGCSPSKRAADLKDEIGDEKWNQIENVLSMKGKKNISDKSRWYEIWRILFPGLREPSNPCRCNGPEFILMALMRNRE